MLAMPVRRRALLLISAAASVAGSLAPKPNLEPTLPATEKCENYAGAERLYKEAKLKFSRSSGSSEKARHCLPGGIEVRRVDWLCAPSPIPREHICTGRALLQDPEHCAGRVGTTAGPER